MPTTLTATQELVTWARSTKDGAGVDAPTCDDSEPLQEFAYCTDGTLRPSEDLCLVAGTTMSSGGPWDKRDLFITNCSSMNEALRRWSYTRRDGVRVNNGSDVCSVQPACGSCPVSAGHRALAISLFTLLAPLAMTEFMR